MWQQGNFSPHSSWEHSFLKVWLQGKRISLQQKIQVYDARVVSVLMCGSCSWAAPEHVLEKHDTARRRHLRSILFLVRDVASDKKR